MARISGLILVSAVVIGMLLLVAGASADDPGTSGGVIAYAGDQLPDRVALSEIPGPSGVTGQAVIGPDERVQITETTVYPWRAIAYLELYDSQGQVLGQCTGTFVSANAVLTAGHCLRTAGEWVGDVAVVPGKSSANEPFGYGFGENWWVPDEWFNTENVDFDWGIIKMPSSTLGNTVGWFTVANASTSTLAQPDFTPAIVGYPGDKPTGTMWGATKPQFVSVEPFTLVHDIDTFGGQSGSALFSANVNKPYLGYIVGIHVRGNAIVGLASRIDAELLADLLTACSQMGCALSYTVEPTQPPTPTPTPTPTPAASSFKSPRFC